MRKITLILTMVIGLAVASSAKATLFDRGGGLIFDDVLNITWLQDANYAKTSGFDADGQFTWTNANAWADGLMFGGFDDWRLASMDVDGNTIVQCLATFTEQFCLDNEYGYMFHQTLGGGSFDNFTGNITVGGVNLNNIQLVYWSGTEFTPNPNNAWVTVFDGGLGTIDGKGSEWAAWAVRPGDSAPIPEPSTLLLLGSGLAGLGFFRWRRKAA